MDVKGTKYERKEEHIFRISYRGENADKIPVYMVFDKEGEPLVQFKCWEIINLESKRDLAYQICNSMNEKFRWVKFYVDKDGDINCEADAILTVDTAAKVSYEMLQRMVDIIDTAYPDFAKARWA